jgi:hypothetical protein
MAATSYKIRGIEPPDLGSYPPETRKLYWSWVVELGLRAKGKEILAGLDKDGKVMRIEKQTREHRKSAMTSSGKGDPDAPALIPGWQKSRTYSLLAGRAVSTHADFYWRFDSFTGRDWGQVLKYQAEQGRDTIGLSPAGIAKVKVQSWAKWDAWKAASVRDIAIESRTRATTTAARTSARQPGESITVNKGRAPTSAATYGINADGPRKGHGGRTPAEWDAYFRQTASAKLPGRPESPGARSPISGPNYNRIIKHTWNQGSRPGEAGTAAPVAPRPGPRIPEPPIAHTGPVNRLPTIDAAKPPKGATSAADFIGDVLRAAQNVPTARLYHGKAWIHDVWAEYTKLGAISASLAGFKLLIVAEYSLRMRMSRADLVQAMNPGDVDSSDTFYRIGGRTLATFNFFKVRA